MKDKAVFKTDFVNGSPVLPSPEVLGFNILGYSVFNQHVNRNHSTVQLWIWLPDEVKKNALKGHLDWDHDIEESE